MSKEKLLRSIEDLKKKNPNGTITVFLPKKGTSETLTFSKLIDKIEKGELD